MWSVITHRKYIDKLARRLIVLKRGARSTIFQWYEGMIVAPRISEDLKLAASMVPNVEWLGTKTNASAISKVVLSAAHNA